MIFVHHHCLRIGVKRILALLDKCGVCVCVYIMATCYCTEGLIGNHLSTFASRGTLRLRIHHRLRTTFVMIRLFGVGLRSSSGENGEGWMSESIIHRVLDRLPLTCGNFTLKYIDDVKSSY